MIYRVYLYDDLASPVETIRDCYYLGENSSHIFYKVRPSEPQYVFPSTRFVIMREV